MTEILTTAANGLAHITLNRAHALVQPLQLSPIYQGNSVTILSGLHR